MQLSVFLAILIPSAVLSALLSARHKRRALARQLRDEWGAKKAANPMDADAMAAEEQP